MKCGTLSAKIISFLLVLIIFLFAAGPVSVKAAGAVTLTVSSATAAPGTDVVISVNISENSGLAAATFLLAYDTNKLTYKSSAAGPAASGGLSSINPNYTVVGNIKTINDSFISSPAITAGGSMLNVTFTVKAGWTGSTPLTLSTKDFAGSTYQEIPKTIINGSVSIPSGPFVAITDSEGTEIGAVLPVKLGVFGFYRNKALKLGFETNVTGATVKWVSSNDKLVLVGETSGIITNRWIFARSADITVTLTKDSTVVTDTVRVVFYKYGWQLDYFIQR